MASENEKTYDLESSYPQVTTELRDLHRPTLPTIPSMVGISRQTLERTNSISMMSGPAVVNPSAKLPGVFRTLRSVVILLTSRRRRF